MKKLVKYCIFTLAAATILPACKKEEVYDTQVTRQISMTLDGEVWNHYYGTNNPQNRPIFIYHPDGTYYASYNGSWNFALPTASYLVVGTNQTLLMHDPANLNDEIIEQDPEGKQTFAFSAPTPYEAGDAMNLAIKTRTGKIRLRALDEKPDKSYASIRANISTPVKGYKVADESIYTDGTNMEMAFTNETGGGVGYTQEVVLIGSDSHKVNVTLDYLDAQGNVVNTKAFAEDFTVLPNQLTEVSFELNNPNEPVIMTYDILIGSLDWRENEVFPSVRVEVPEGYTYVAPGEDLTSVIKEQLADASVTDMKIFLKAGANYTIADKTLEPLTKSLHLLGQTPGYGQSYASVSLVNISMTGDFDRIRFENLTLAPQKDRLFNLRNQMFHIGEIAFVNCSVNNWSGTLWAQTAAADNEQAVDNIIMEGCRMTNISTSTPLWNITSRRIAPIGNIRFTNTLFHGRNFGTRNAILTGLSKINTPISITVEGCTFADTRGVSATYFDITCPDSPTVTLTVNGNTVTGAKGGTATWFKLSDNVRSTAYDNFRTAGYEMKAYGVEPPAESSKTYEDILSQFNL